MEATETTTDADMFANTSDAFLEWQRKDAQARSNRARGPMAAQSARRFADRCRAEQQRRAAQAKAGA